MKVVKIVLLVPAVLVGLLLCFVSFLLAFWWLPDGIVWTALGMMALLFGWFIFGRQKSAGIVPGSESSLGRQTFKDGLL